jgi:uncharacterized surface protein with fasciclin (FAS1) repeats
MKHHDGSVYRALRVGFSTAEMSGTSDNIWTGVRNMTALKKTVIATVAAAAFALASLPAKAADIVDTAVSAGSFKTLVTAVQAAGLVDTLKGEGPFTVFAPTDEAFAKLPAGTVEDLLKPENKEKLVAILTYHVVPGKVMAADIAGKEMEVASVQGDTIDVNATSGVMVDGATVTQADIEADNGVIHVIDTVIMPAM